MFTLKLFNHLNYQINKLYVCQVQGWGTCVEALLYRGLLPRSEVQTLLGVGERQARRVVASLSKQKILTSTNRRAPLSLAFPPRLAPRLMPGLFPDR